MHRLYALFAALVLTSMTVSSACIAAPANTLGFTLEPSGSSNHIQAHFRKPGQGTNRWSSSFSPAELSGLDLARFRASGTTPLGFAIAREAGRLDCTGTGGNSRASGSCRFTPDAGFMAMLSGRGIARPTEQQSHALMALDVRRELVETLAAARYPTPSVNDLIGLTAVGVSNRYIEDLARVGYRPKSLATLLEFKALDITPDFIRGFVEIGYGDLPPGQLIQLKALAITPHFVTGFERLGYRRLPVGKLVEMKALGVTPEYVRSIQRDGTELPSVDQLVKLRAIGFEPRKR